MTNRKPVPWGLPAISIAAAAALLLWGCAQEVGPLGSESNPIKMAFVPSLETGAITTSAEELADAIEEKTGYKIEVSVPVSYAAVIEAMGAGRVDVAWFAPLSYVLARERVGAKIILITERDGETDYFGIILARKDSPVKSIADLKGRKFAFVDPLSTSGTLYPQQLLLDKGIDPAKDIEPVFAGGHDKAIIALYNKQVDGCSCYGGYKQDARNHVVETIPNIKESTVIIGRTAKIPNDNVSVSKDLPEEISDKIRDALLEISGSPEGKQMLLDVADIDGLQRTDDGVYETVRDMAAQLDLDIKKVVDKE